MVCIKKMIDEKLKECIAQSKHDKNHKKTIQALEVLLNAF